MVLCGYWTPPGPLQPILYCYINFYQELCCVVTNCFVSVLDLVVFLYYLPLYCCQYPINYWEKQCANSVGFSGAWGALDESVHCTQLRNTQLYHVHARLADQIRLDTCRKPRSSSASMLWSVMNQLCCRSYIFVHVPLTIHTLRIEKKSLLSLLSIESSSGNKKVVVEANNAITFEQSVFNESHTIKNENIIKNPTTPYFRYTDAKMSYVAASVVTDRYHSPHTCAED